MPAQVLGWLTVAGGILVSTEVVAEYRAVLQRPRLARRIDAGYGNTVVDRLLAASVHVTPQVAVTDCRDAKDNKYLELALAGAADVIVSSDADLLVLDPWRSIRIVTPAAFLDLLPAG